MSERPPPYVIRRAEHAAELSPCAKSRRGAALFNRVLEDARVPLTEPTCYSAVANAIIAASAFNGQPSPFTCDGGMMCKTHCAKLCLHAEERAIAKAGALDDCVDLELVHVKIGVSGTLVPGGGPSCWQCSRKVVEAKLRGVWLFEGQRWHDAVYCDGPCGRVNIIAQGAGSTGVCAHCSRGMLRFPGKRVYAADSGQWRFYSAEEFHRVTLAANGMTLR